MTIRDIDNAVRNGGADPIYIQSSEITPGEILLNNTLRSYNSFMSMPVVGLCSNINNCFEQCVYITVDAPASVLRAWEEATRWVE